MKITDCKECKFLKTVHATGNFDFKGCYCAPNKGKWIAKIEKCPLAEELGVSLDGEVL